MILTDEIEVKLHKLRSEAKEIEDFVNFRIFDLDAIKENQIGYSVDQAGNSLISEKEGSWRAEWLVIGCSILCGDPIVMDTSETGCPILMLMHGMCDWSGGTYLSQTLDLFIDEISIIGNFIYENIRENTVLAVTCDSLNGLISSVIEIDGDGDANNWKALLTPIYQSAQNYEDFLASKVSELSAEGMNIKAISEKLDMPAKDVYSYLRRVSTDEN